MTERFQKLLEATAKAEYGGPIPRSVWQIAQWAGEEVRNAILRQQPDFDRSKLHAIQMNAVDAALTVQREAIYRERHRAGSPDWNSGFGNVSHVILNGRK